MKTEILAKVDHTLLAPDATWEDIRLICDDGLTYQTATVCIPPVFLAKAKAYVGDRLPLCTVVGFPCGYTETTAKVMETKLAVENGADEIDMVIRVSWVKEGQWQKITDEIRAVKEACDGCILKVIVETCLLTDEEKARLPRIVADGGADYIKTSTGFSRGGATREDVAIFAANRPDGLLIKAAGGISSFEDARDFIALGADRLGTSRLVKLAKENS
ncbi:MAG: deoxyribose-phosphate aldolase [Clostridia bacterium]|nr:deoxyribose-phosphate aldolase [Clostridia bacterium]